MSDIDLRTEQSVSLVNERERLLALGGFVLVRQRKHRVWRNQRGQVYVESCSPSDVRSQRNALARLRRIVEAS